MIVVLIFVVCLLIGVPIAFVLGLTGLAHVAYLGDPSYYGAIINRMFAGLNSTGLLAIPFFIIAGELMNEGGITKRLFALFRELVIQIRGGLAYAVVIVSAVLAAILGSANAVSSILCKVAIPEMKEDGYPEEFSGALIASSAVLGPIIPPSTTFVYYSVLTGVSVRALFLAGIVPGILLALGFISVIFVQGKIYHLYPAPTQKFNFSRLGKAFVAAIPALLIPIIMMGGSLTGIFTPTESGVVAVVASIIVGLFYKTLDLKKLPGALVRAGMVSAALLIIIAFGNIMSWTLAIAGVKQVVMTTVLAITTNKYLILLICIALMIAVGCVMDATAAMLVFIPVLTPLADLIGMDPIHFGLVYCLLITVGLVTPPVGMTLFVTSNVSGISLSKICKAVLPFAAAAMLITIALAYLPQVVMWLPTVFA